MVKRNRSSVVRDLTIGNRTIRYYSLEAATEAGLKDIARLPYSLKVLLENALRHEDGRTVTTDDIAALAAWPQTRRSAGEIAFYPVRILMPDSSGIPLMADLAAMRDAMRRLGGDPAQVNPVIPAQLIVDHSVNVDVAGRADAVAQNMAMEYTRNGERYSFLKWAQRAFSNLAVVPPGVGICHQINVEYLARLVWTAEGEGGGPEMAFPDSLLGMDSHTPMVNSLGVFGWGVGGIEAAAALLGQPVSVPIPEVIGCRLTGRPRSGLTATDVILTLTQVLRAKGVVQKFVEYWGDGVAALTLTDRATIANMAPEYGATMGFFPIDVQTLEYLALSGRDAGHIALVEAYARAQGLWRDANTPEPAFTDVVEVDLAAIEPCMAGPHRPQDRVRLAHVPETVAQAVSKVREANGNAVPPAAPDAGDASAIGDGDVAIAAITSCTNSSNPTVILAAGLLARNALARGLKAKPWVKTSLAPGSRVVAAYLEKAGLQGALDALGFQLVGFGCTTCLGNSGPLAEPVRRAVEEKGLMVAAVTSSNRNFEGRVHPQCRMAYLASPPMVVACALAGTLTRNLTTEPLGYDPDGKPVRLADIWPGPDDIRDALHRAVTSELFRQSYADVFVGGRQWDALDVSDGVTFAWDEASTYILRPPFFDETSLAMPSMSDIRGGRPLLILGDSITTDHISPVGTITADSLAGRYLVDRGIMPDAFNSFAGRRVNHHVMMRGGFANIRLRNEMVPGTEGGFTRHMPDGGVTTVYDAAMAYKTEGVPLVVVAGKEYGAGSSRDWAAKVTRLLGIRAVIAESFERIHRSNLICMGVLPLQFTDGATRHSLQLDGSEVFDIEGIAGIDQPGGKIACRIHRTDGTGTSVWLHSRLDTRYEVDYWRHGGILDYVLRALLGSETPA
jgi:aconitate hydratase